MCTFNDCVAGAAAILIVCLRLPTWSCYPMACSICAQSAVWLSALSDQQKLEVARPVGQVDYFKIGLRAAESLLPLRPVMAIHSRTSD